MFFYNTKIIKVVYINKNEDLYNCKECIKLSQI